MQTTPVSTPASGERITAASKGPVLHIVCERDVGLFNLVLGVIPHTYWALRAGRVPIIYYGKNNCYWIPEGYRGRDTVWEYYFEPVAPEYPASRIPPHVLRAIADAPPNNRDRFVDEFAFVSSHGGWGIKADGEAFRGGGSHTIPSRRTRKLASDIVQAHIRPRDYIVEKANAFFDSHLAGKYLIGVHIRGTDALVDTNRKVRQTRVNFRRYLAILRKLRRSHPDSRIFVASDDQASVDRFQSAFDDVVAYDSIRHQAGEMAGKGPAGGIMPAYLTKNPGQAAKNGEDAVIEYLLLSRCNYLVHNLSSIPYMVLMAVPDMPETNADQPSFRRRAIARIRREKSAFRRRLKTVHDTLKDQPIGSWYRLLCELRETKLAARRAPDGLEAGSSREI